MQGVKEEKIMKVSSVVISEHLQSPVYFSEAAKDAAKISASGRHTSIETVLIPMHSFLLLSLFFASSSAFLLSARTNRWVVARKMADDDANEELFKNIAAKMSADPNYNPMADPQAMQVLDSIIPQNVKDVGTAIERLKVAFKDATEGPDAKPLSELSDLATKMANKEILSSPTSKWFREGSPETWEGDDAEEGKNMPKELSAMKEEMTV